MKGHVMRHEIWFWEVSAPVVSEVTRTLWLNSSCINQPGTSPCSLPPRLCRQLCLLPAAAGDKGSLGTQTPMAWLGGTLTLG